MAQIARLSNGTDWIELEVVGKEETRRELMRFGIELFLDDLTRKHAVSDAEFLVDGAPWLKAALHHAGLRFRHVTHGNRNSVKRVFKEVKRRTQYSANHPATPTLTASNRGCKPSPSAGIV